MIQTIMFLNILIGFGCRCGETVDACKRAKNCIWDRTKSWLAPCTSVTKLLTWPSIITN